MKFRLGELFPNINQSVSEKDLYSCTKIVESIENTTSILDKRINNKSLTYSNVSLYSDSLKNESKKLENIFASFVW